ncbi:MAG: hypothetical protein ACPLSA_06695, partial [Caldanaerobacter sp.]
VVSLLLHVTTVNLSSYSTNTFLILLLSSTIFTAYLFPSIIYISEEIYDLLADALSAANTTSKDETVKSSKIKNNEIAFLTYSSSRLQYFTILLNQASKAHLTAKLKLHHHHLTKII